MEALPGPSGMRRLMRSRVVGCVVVRRGRGRTIAIWHAPRVALRGGAVAGSPGGMWVRVALHGALLVGWRFMVIELIVLVIVETVALHTLRRAGAPVSMTGGAGRAVVGRRRVMVRGKRGLRARRTEPTRGRGRQSVLLAGRGGSPDGLTDHGRVGNMGPGRSGGLG